MGLLSWIFGTKKPTKLRQEVSPHRVAPLPEESYDCQSEVFEYPLNRCKAHKQPQDVSGVATRVYNERYPQADFNFPADFTAEEKAYFDEHRDFVNGGLWGNEAEREQRIKWQHEANEKALAFGPIQPRYIPGKGGKVYYRECPICLVKQARKERAASMIAEAIKVHGDQFDYSKVEYVDDNTPVTVICRVHGEHKIRLQRHAAGRVSCACNKKLPDTVYLWKADGLEKFGHQVYKIGVTRKRLGKTRIEQVAKAGGFTPEILAFEEVGRTSAYPIEAQLKGIGTRAFSSRAFDGATEFFAMNDAELAKALDIIYG